MFTFYEQYPTSSTQDKILFMINNLSSSNIEAKAKEFTELLSEQHYPWFAQYMVMKRLEIRNPLEASKSHSITTCYFVVTKNLLLDVMSQMNYLSEQALSPTSMTCI